MVNKQKLFKALKEEMEAKAAIKAAQRKMSRMYDKVASGVFAKKEAEAEARARAEAERKEGIATRKAQRKKMVEDKTAERKGKKADIMKLLDKLYNDEETGFGSKRELYNQAKEKEPLVTMQEIDEFFKEMSKKEPPLKDMFGHNSWIGNLPREQYQLDTGYINKGITEELAEGDDGYFLVCIDVFSKRAEVVPMFDVTSEEATKAFMKCVARMGFPREVYTDEGSEFKKKFAEYVQQEHIIHTTTKTHARFAERFIRWVKMQLYKRRKLPGNWVKKLPVIVAKWNNSEHGSLNMSAAEAHKDENALQVKLALIMDSKNTRTYPDLKVGDMVRIKKKRGKLEKETKAVWSEEVYKIDFIYRSHAGYSDYVLEGKDGMHFLRHELLKVDV